MKTKLLTALLTLAIALLCAATPVMADEGDCTTTINFTQTTPPDYLETVVYWLADLPNTGSIGQLISAYLNAGNDPCNVTIDFYPYNGQ